MPDEPLEDEPERLTEPADDDYMDVSIESPPTIYTTHKIKWSLIKDSLSGVSGTTNTVAMFTSSTAVGDSPLTVDTGNVSLLAGTLGIGVAADPTTDLWMETTKEFPVYIDQNYTGGGSSAIFGSADGVGSGTKVGGDFRAKESTDLNVGVKGVAGTQAISHDPFTDGFSQIGGVIQTATTSTDDVAGAYITVNGAGTGNAYAGYFKISNTATGDSVGVFVDSSSTTGTAYVGQFKDGTEGLDKVLTCVTADGKAQWAEIPTSTNGWLGSETRIKIAPWDIVSYNDKDGVSIQNNGGVVNDAAAKITTMVTGVFIPTGYRATAFMINASANIAVELFESQIDDDTQVSKNSGNANTEVNITNVDSTTTNYLSIIIVEAGNDIYGGYITIEKI
jgi:hypothetical protein